jgi:hypothetical protein
LTQIAARPHFFHTIVNALDKHGRPAWSENYTNMIYNLFQNGSKKIYL